MKTRLIVGLIVLDAALALIAVLLLGVFGANNLF